MITSGRFYIDLSAREIRIKLSDTNVEYERIPLTRSEYQICEYLVRNKGQVFLWRVYWRRHWGMIRRATFPRSACTSRIFAASSQNMPGRQNVRSVQSGG